MLSKPLLGWTEVTIGDFKASASYVTDVPINCMKSMIYALQTKNDFVVTFDVEGWEFKVIADYYNCFVIKDICEQPILFTFRNISIHQLAKELVEDIENNLNEWKYWNYDSDLDSEEDINNYEKELKNCLTTLKKLITNL